MMDIIATVNNPCRGLNPTLGVFMKHVKAAWIIAAAVFAPRVTHADDAECFRFLVEAGVLTTVNQEISGYKQPSATAGWRSVNPDLRLEASYAPYGYWKLGAALQPVYATYSARLTSDLLYKDTTYAAGSDGELTYLFPTLRLTGNYPVLGGDSQSKFLRLGLSVVARYAELRFRAGAQRFTDTNFLVIPLLNFEAETDLGGAWGFVASGDFLPGIDGNIFLDGLFDVLGGVRYRFDSGKTLDAGLRLFFGGYDPKTPNDYANRIFFAAPVVRFGW